ncbi:putative SAC3 GANP family [Trypanosoma vivax]|uniref:SAC3/GANP/THP3 conserved domain-containing protein n=1 Tax=Trypanosoma vivax (strain Y486) TaxID=1055687 RepID=G0U2P6_TRYVY|nr:hypothetical protein TRVL_02267 [Trypanosoma vivax]KAH8604360.1 putative SAC3 GANP family [Trypanosoma vivax]CCC50549.1 conserved hypothetical protein [Trypanosoma vivax Y486]
MKGLETCLTVEFFSSRGVPVPKSLREWLQNAAYLAKTRNSEEERCRYERWAVGKVEDAMRSPGGVTAFNWSGLSPVMPHNAPERELILLSHNNVVKPAPPTVDYRLAIYMECVRRTPAEVHPFIKQVFDKIDMDVASGRRRYESLTFMEVLQMAQELQRVYQQQLSVAPALRCVNPRAMGHADDARTKLIEKISNGVGEKTHRSDQEAGKPPKSRRVESHRHGDYGGDELIAEEIASTRRFFQDLVSRDAPVAVPPTFVGKSQELERNYSRYEPTAEDIRPRSVLVKALEFVTSKAKEKESSSDALAAYRYLNEQLKGMRQDLRVQNIVDEFAVEVYEKHALICLELADIGEFNQCQASLKKLYEGLPSAAKTSISDFFCYRLAYLSLGGQHDAFATELILYTTACSSENKELKGPSAHIKRKDVRWTLKLCSACEGGDCFTMIRSLAVLPPGMHPLVKIYLQRCRLRWLRELLVGVRGLVSVRFVIACLGFLPVHTTLRDAEGEKGEFWLDGSLEKARQAFKDFFETIKFQLPPDCSFDKEIKRNYERRLNKWEQPGGDVVERVDAIALFKCVEAYITYLGTRRDARLDSAD